MLHLEDRIIPITDDLEAVKNHILDWDDVDNSPVVTYRLEDDARLKFNLEALMHESASRATRLTIEMLERIAPELLRLYEEIYGMSVEQADRLHTTRDLGAHIDAFAGSPQIHVNLTLEDRMLRAVNIEREMLGRAFRSGEPTIEMSKAKLFLDNSTYGGIISYGDLTFMRDCLHHFGEPGIPNQPIDAVRLSQRFEMPEELLIPSDRHSSRTQ